jgi:predicted DNA-binding ribbon-helix-helix protein
MNQFWKMLEEIENAHLSDCERVQLAFALLGEIHDNHKDEESYDMALRALTAFQKKLKEKEEKNASINKKTDRLALVSR